MLRRRGLLSAALGLMAVPALVKAEAIMPVRSWSPVADWIEREMWEGRIISGDFRPERPLKLHMREGLILNTSMVFPNWTTGMAHVSARGSGRINGLFVSTPKEMDRWRETMKPAWLIGERGTIHG